MKPIEEFTKDTKVHEVLKLLASGKVNQRIAQATAWHFANDMSWQELAAKKIDRLGRPDEPYFNRTELRSALQVAATRRKNRQGEGKEFRPRHRHAHRSRSDRQSIPRSSAQCRIAIQARCGCQADPVGRFC